MVPTSKCSDVGDHICAVVYTTSYVRQIWVGAVYYTARTYIGHDNQSSAQLWLSLSYIRGGITEIGYFASWEGSSGLEHASAGFEQGSPNYLGSNRILRGSWPHGPPSLDRVPVNSPLGTS